MYPYPGGMPFTKLISAAEVIAFRKQPHLPGEVLIGFYESDLSDGWGFVLALKTKSPAMWDELNWVAFVRFCRSFAELLILTLFPEHNLKCPFVCDLYYMIHSILYIWFTLFHVVLYI